ncbi:hypothetical protein [Selenomonas sp. AB3002]|uniref:hypothetical protein n=1 Tax=Selenomonas sp. AB3002 TaxID=1392502 RepID=UPI000494DB65
MSQRDERSGSEVMDRLFGGADFAAENEGLEERLRERILGRLADAGARPYASIESEEERELGREEFSVFVAAGTGADAAAKKARMLEIAKSWLSI